MKIRIFKERLSDGSHVYNVAINYETFKACSEKDAESFAEAIRAATVNYTVDVPIVEYTY